MFLENREYFPLENTNVNKKYEEITCKTQKLYHLAY